MKSLVICRAQRGVVLILTLLFLAVLTLLTLSLFEMALLQNKISSNFNNEEIALLHAESGLLAAQKMLTAFPTSGTATGEGWRYACQQQNQTLCDTTAKDCYRVTATGQAGYAKVILQAIYQVNVIKTNEGEWYKISRKSWLQKHEET